MLQTVLEITHGPLERECCPLHEAQNPGYSRKVPVPFPLQAGVSQGWIDTLSDAETDDHHRRDDVWDGEA